jgi:lysophospholipase L1-like esterase
MTRKLCTLVAALVLAFLSVQPSATAAATPATAAAAPVRIMPLGDSITAGPGCWRALLWDRLQRTGYTDTDFVGTQTGGGCAVAHDGDHEGHGGYSATGIADQNQLPGWLAATNPHIVLVHLGTNDLWGGTIPTAAILTAYTKLVGQMRANNPDVKVIVAQIIPMEPANCTGCAQRVVSLNNAIPGWAAGLSTSRSPITVVDQWTGFSAATDTFDGVHPVDSGFQKMSDRWYPALTSAIGGTTPPDDPPPPGTCTADYHVTGQWADGFQGEVTVHNGTTAALTGWTVTLTFGGGQRISQAWNATVTQSGAVVTARNVGWNGALAPGTSAVFGFLASWSGANPVPLATCAPA